MDGIQVLISWLHTKSCHAPDIFPHHIYNHNKVRNFKINVSESSPLLFIMKNDWEDNYEDQGYQNCQYNQLYLHILQPHFSTDFGPWVPEVLCLPQKQQTASEETSRFERKANVLFNNPNPRPLCGKDRKW